MKTLLCSIGTGQGQGRAGAMRTLLSRAGTGQGQGRERARTEQVRGIKDLVSRYLAEWEAVVISLMQV